MTSEALQTKCMIPTCEAEVQAWTPGGAGFCLNHLPAKVYTVDPGKTYVLGPDNRYREEPPLPLGYYVSSLFRNFNETEDEA